jgi:hypothetical protein
MSEQVYVSEYWTYKTVTWYTLTYEETGIKSLNDFFTRMSELGDKIGNEKIKQDLQDLANWMKNIGDSIYGVNKSILREERRCYALPHKQVKGLGLRLYCYWVSEQIIILFNGGIKTENNPEHCPNIRQHFYQAQSWSKQLENIGILHNGRKITNLEELYLNS